MRHDNRFSLKLFANPFMKLLPLLAVVLIAGRIEGVALAFSKAPTPAPAAPLFYRGMTEKQASIESVLLRMAGIEPSVIPSWRFSYLAAKNPSLPQPLIREMLDRDIAFWRNSKTLGRFLECHSDFAECRHPYMSVLRAESFQAGDITEDISSLGFEKAQELFSHFDPVISTSVSKEVAQSFVRDKISGLEVSKSFLLTLLDRNHRNCPQAQLTGDNSQCIIQMTEYIEEQEFPFLGYILPEEIYAVERLGTSVTSLARSDEGSLAISLGRDTRIWKCGGKKIPQAFYNRLDQTIAAALKTLESHCRL